MQTKYEIARTQFLLSFVAFEEASRLTLLVRCSLTEEVRRCEGSRRVCTGFLYGLKITSITRRRARHRRR